MTEQELDDVFGSFETIDLNEGMPTFGPWGIIPTFLTDPTKSALENFQANYCGRAIPFEGHKVIQGGPDMPYMIQYPQDPPHLEVSRMHFNEELLILFSYAWVMIVQPDESFVIVHMD